MMRHRHDLREPFDNTVEEPDVIALRADRNDFQAAFLGDVGNLSGITIVDAYHRRAAGRDDISKQTELGGEIALDVWVIVEMIARQIGERAGCNAHAVEPILIEAV